MNEKIDQLVDALRHELQEYGEMLALFEQQQDFLMRREADQVMNTVALIHAQAQAVQDARGRRVRRHQDLAEQVGLPPDRNMTDVIRELPAARQPQVQALMDENNRLLKRIQQRARQNHLMLTHSLEHMGRFLNILMGAGNVQVYDGAGSKSGSALAGRSLYEAVG